jgi:hypothetical protein
MTKAESANMTAKASSPSAGAFHVPNRRCKRSSSGTDAASPTTANSAVPPDPATKAVPASRPMWCRTWGASPRTLPKRPVKTSRARRGLPALDASVGDEGWTRDPEELVSVRLMMSLPMSECLSMVQDGRVCRDCPRVWPGMSADQCRTSPLTRDFRPFPCFAGGPLSRQRRSVPGGRFGCRGFCVSGDRTGWSSCRVRRDRCCGSD